MKLFIFIIVLISASVSAQWQGVINVPKTSPVSDIYFNGSIAVACADSIIYTSEDEGINWIHSGVINKNIGYILSAAVYKNSIFVGTTNSGVFESSDGGKTWKSRNNGFTGLGSEYINKLTVRGDSLYA